MKPFGRLSALFFVALCCNVFAEKEAQIPSIVRGVVFHDQNRNGAKDAEEPGIAGIPVSDQNVIVKTDVNGEYELPFSGNATVYVNTPSEWEAPKDSYTGVPQFFRNLHVKDKGVFKATGPVPASVDFGLMKRTEKNPDKFDAVIMGDSQLSDEMFYAYEADIVNELMGMASPPGFVMTLGDVCAENLKSMREIAHLTSLSGSAVYGVIGNHDRDYNGADVMENAASFKNVYGPDYYSFDRGNVHFVVLNSIYYTGPGGGYEQGFEGRQLGWLKQDLLNTPKDKRLMLCMHAPIEDPFHGKDELLAILEDREAPIMAVAGHMHLTYAVRLTEKQGWKGKQPFVCAVLPHACGSWWEGPKDYRGIPLSDHTDGTPNGYTVWNFDRDSMTVDFKPSGLSDTFLARIYTPDQRTISQSTIGLEKDTILVNAFMTFSDADVQLSIDGNEWKSMEKVNGMRDPYIDSMMSGPYSSTGKWLPIEVSNHLWKLRVGKVLSGRHDVRVRYPGIDGRTVYQGKNFRM